MFAVFSIIYVTVGNKNKFNCTSKEKNLRHMKLGSVTPKSRNKNQIAARKEF
jgi:hypothetical protein